jgi:hypothetical protein
MKLASKTVEQVTGIRDRLSTFQRRPVFTSDVDRILADLEALAPIDFTKSLLLSTKIAGPWGRSVTIPTAPFGRRHRPYSALGLMS